MVLKGQLIVSKGLKNKKIWKKTILERLKAYDFNLISARGIFFEKTHSFLYEHRGVI
jgi:hypothetical protein